MTALHDATPIVDQAIPPNGRVSIRLVSAEVRLTAGDTDRVTIRTGNGAEPGERLEIESTDGELVVRERDLLGLAFGKHHGTRRLDVRLPAAADTTVDIASGRIEANGLRGRQRYRTASGDVAITDGAGPIEVTAVSGDVAIALTAAASLNLRTVSGDVAVAGGSVESLHVSTTSGDVRVDSPITGTSGNAIESLSGDATLVALAGITVVARTVSGDLSSDLPHRSDGRTGRRTLVIGDGRVELSFRSVSGDLRIRRAGKDSAGPGVVAAAPSTLVPTPPAQPAPPEPPSPPEPVDDAGAPTTARQPRDVDAERMAILQALERGELDIATSMDRLAELDELDEVETADASDA